ncbi:hypothetical protein OKW98_18570 [Pseudomonas sp. KU26590]|uniref:hypothetical protein n=1 Tax=Pseudomonas sp. KU26590 TaxID=2991051 RepID=UPI00223DE360|nr:hypothetical protein [Pseudomonas sp. KU26590]UZJ58582.1 hypothetical protein OKW98_18570 [Pseudomonas sp. KU26590]
MSDLTTKPKPNNAPTYMCLYPRLAEIARSNGYALAVHGSLARDMDLVAVPWVESPSEPEVVITAIESTFAIRRIGELTPAPHGRLVQTIGIQFGECFIDLSFMQLTGAGFKAGTEAAAKLIDNRIAEYVSEHGIYDHDTGTTEFPGNGDEMVEEWDGLASSIRGIKP